MLHTDTVLVVESDPCARDEICKLLDRAGYRSEGIQCRIESCSAVRANTYACILVSVEPPELAGLEILAWAREQSIAALVALSSAPVVEVRIDAFLSGAELFIPKPVDERELLAALLSVSTRRRSLVERLDPGNPRLECRSLRGDAWVLDFAAWRLQSPQGRLMSLTSNELVLLRALIVAAGEVVSRETLLQLFYRRCDASANRALDAIVLRLRRKTRSHFECELPLRTKHGSGYMFTAGALATPEDVMLQHDETRRTNVSFRG